MNRAGQGRFKAYSAGSHRRAKSTPTRSTCCGIRISTPAFARSKDWEEFAKPGAPELDFVFTVCDNAANESCPVWPGQPMTAHWGVPDPAAAEGTEAEKRLAFSDAYRMLNSRISIFTSLPLASIDRLALQKRLDAIGQSSRHGWRRLRQAPRPQGKASRTQDSLTHGRHSLEARIDIGFSDIVNLIKVFVVSG